LVGLGIDELSASPTYLPEIKRVVRAMDQSEARALAGSALSMQSAEEVTARVDEWLRARAADIMRFLDADAETTAPATEATAPAKEERPMPEPAPNAEEL
jgi:hypothetical protein